MATLSATCLIGLSLLAAVLAAPHSLGAAAKRMPPDGLAVQSDLPDPLTFVDGSKVRDGADWSRRRQELIGLIQAYEYGELPPVGGKVTAAPDQWVPIDRRPDIQGERAEQPTEPPAGTQTQELRLSMGPEGKVSTHLILTIPPHKEGQRLPVIVRGDLCWGRAAPAIVAMVMERGYTLAEFDRTEIVPDKNEHSAGLCLAFPDGNFGAIAGWAWGYSRVIDYLVTRDDIDSTHIAITGHSRGGKATLLAGALDERIALVNPNNSGCGGAGCFRFQADKSEDIAAILKNFPFWFEPHFGEFIGKVDRLPFDQHSVKALVAPRALLTTEGLGDLWANPEGTQHTHLAAKPVFEMLGAPQKIGIHYRPGKHEHGVDDWAALLDFADWQFKNTKPARSFDKLAFEQTQK